MISGQGSCHKDYNEKRQIAAHFEKFVLLKSNERLQFVEKTPLIVVCHLNE